MLKITIRDTPGQRRLVLEGKLIAPWAAELRKAYKKAAADLDDREVVIDVRHLTFINEDGEKVLQELMNEGARFRSSGVFTKHLLKQLARRKRRNSWEATK